MTAYDWLWELNLACCGFFSNEKPKQKASNGELRRWFAKKCISINGAFVEANNLIDEVQEIVLFPKNEKKRISFKF